MFERLTRTGRFKSGHAMWLLFYEKKRPLFKEINLRTSFLLEKIGEEREDFEALLIKTSHIFPNDFLLTLPLSENWAKESFDRWEKMDKPSFRVFLPLKGEEEELERAWKNSGFHHLSFYKEKQ